MCHSLIFKGRLSSFLHPFSRIYPFYSATVSMETQQLQLFNLNFIDQFFFSILTFEFFQHHTQPSPLTIYIISFFCVFYLSFPIMSPALVFYLTTTRAQLLNHRISVIMVIVIIFFIYVCFFSHSLSLSLSPSLYTLQPNKQQQQQRRMNEKQ